MINGGRDYQALRQLKETIDKDITMNDITTALYKLMKEGKSPGNDGLTVCFYRKMWKDIAKMVMDHGCD